MPSTYVYRLTNLVLHLPCLQFPHRAVIKQGPGLFDCKPVSLHSPYPSTREQPRSCGRPQESQDNRDPPKLWHGDTQAIFLEQLLVCG